MMCYSSISPFFQQPTRVFTNGHLELWKELHAQKFSTRQLILIQRVRTYLMF